MSDKMIESKDAAEEAFLTAMPECASVGINSDATYWINRDIDGGNVIFYLIHLNDDSHFFVDSRDGSVMTSFEFAAAYG